MPLIYLCWGYDSCGRDEQESILGGFGKELMGIGAMDDQSQFWLGGLRILGPLMKLKPAMAATVLVEETREEAEA